MTISSPHSAAQTPAEASFCLSAWQSRFRPNTGHRVISTGGKGRCSTSGGLQVRLPPPGSLVLQVPTGLVCHLFGLWAKCEAHPDLLPTPPSLFPTLLSLQYQTLLRLIQLIHFICCSSLHDSLPWSFLRAGFVSLCFTSLSPTQRLVSEDTQ